MNARVVLVIAVTKINNEAMKKLPLAVVIIPTYNEADSIGKMIEHLMKITFPKVKDWECKVLIVDDTSPDGTYKIVQKLQKKYDNLFLSLAAKKSGIGAAYVRGFKYAMEELNADVVIEFDGDFQHPPKDIPVMLKEIHHGADYVLGSRKIKGGSNPKGWGFKRLFLSEMGGLTARFILFFPFKNFFKITDPTTGMKATRVKGFADTIDMDHLYSHSFGYKFEFLYKTVKLGASVKEIPLRFGLRTKGESKIEPQTAKEVLKVVFLLRFFDETTQKFMKFGIIGGFGFVINLLGLKIFSNYMKPLSLEVGVRNGIANALASEISIISNFIFNNLWTFSGQKLSLGKHMLKKFAAFNLSSIFGGILVPTLIIALGTQIFGDDTKTLFLVLAVFGFTVPFNWFVYNTLIWKKKA